MIKLGEGWAVADHRIFHVCGPGARTDLAGGQTSCDCGMLVPRRVRLFRAWLTHGGAAAVVMPDPEHAIPGDGGASGSPE